MGNHKIIFTGPVGAGKTTAISALSDIPVVMTDASAHDMTRQRKATTTVAMDYGLMRLDGNERIHLYGTPGQERFDFMWDILTKGGLGLILLLDNTRGHPLQDMRFFLESFKDFLATRKVAIGVTRMDLSDQLVLDDYFRELRAMNLNPPLFAVDARRRADVAILVESLLYSLDPWLGQA